MPTETIRSNVLVDRAVIDQLELHMVGDARGLGALAGDLELALRQGDAEDVDPGDLVQIERHPAPAAADVEHALPRLERELGGDMRLLVGLRLLEAVAGVGEVSAAILLVVVEEEFVELVLEVVMVGDVAPRALGVVAPEEAPRAASCRAISAARPSPFSSHRLDADDQLEQVEDGPVLDDQRARPYRLRRPRAAGS